MLKPSAFSVTLALVVVAQLTGVAQSAPLANLVLHCPDESAIDQAFDACHGYIYEIPTNELIVVSSSYVWRKAADLAASDLLLVCTIPVEPGAYSSCRDSAGIRRTAFVPKDSVITGGRNSVIVSKTGGDYTDPVTAAQNAFAGDTWCVAPQWPLQPCVMAIGEGIFILSETLSIPEGLAVSGNGKGATMLIADNGIETAVVLDRQRSDQRPYCRSTASRVSLELPALTFETRASRAARRRRLLVRCCSLKMSRFTFPALRGTWLSSGVVQLRFWIQRSPLWGKARRVCLRTRRRSRITL